MTSDIDFTCQSSEHRWVVHVAPESSTHFSASALFSSTCTVLVKLKEKSSVLNGQL